VIQPLNADELFEIAEQIERNGVNFYRRSAQVAVNPKSRQLLQDLAAIEEHHERVFAGMREELWKEDPDWLPKFFDADGETHAAQYLRAVAAGQVFDFKPAPASVINGTESPERILRTAIALEKDAIIFYLSIKRAVPEGLGRSKISDIIDEEMGHITMLSTELADLED
jgi:rubrerythrin